MNVKDLMELFNSLNSLHWSGGLYQWLFYISIILILVFERNKVAKAIFGILPLLYILVIYNPLFYRVMYLVFSDGIRVYYARLMTFIPLIYCIGAGITHLLIRSKDTIRFILLCLVVSLLILFGDNFYNADWMIPTDIIQKVPKDVIEVIDELPREGKNIIAAFPPPLNIYVRQVDSSIIMPFGRDLDALGEALSGEQYDPESIMNLAAAQAVEYVVIRKSDEAISTFSTYGHAPISVTSNYAIYPVVASEKTIQVINDRRLVESKSFSSDNGRRYGYPTRVYEYDALGRRTKETCVDENGKPENIAGGYSSVLTKVSMSNLVKEQSYLDADGNKIPILGRFVTKYSYDLARRVICEAYYDENGRPMNRLDTGYAKKYIEYTNGRVSSEHYTDAQNCMILSSEGYARCDKEYDEGGRVIRESYYGISGEAIECMAGYASVTYCYDEYGNLTDEYYIDRNGQRIDMVSNFKKLDMNCLDMVKKNDAKNILGVSYSWDEEGKCTVSGNATDISWCSLYEGERPYYFIPGETYTVKYSSENVCLRIYFYEDDSWKSPIEPLISTIKDTDFTVPLNCGAMIIRLWVAPGLKIDETVQPRVFLKGDL